MTGIAEVAAIFGIIAGVGSAVRLVIDLRKTYEKRKKGKSRAIQAASSTIEQRLKRLEDQLRSSEPALKQEYTRLGLRPEGRFGNGLGLRPSCPIADPSALSRNTERCL